MSLTAKAGKTRSPLIKVADEVWVALALLHREHPDSEDFPVADIVERVERERIAGRLRPGVYVHVLRHCVANLPPDPARIRMLYATGRSTRRLFRPGDRYDPGREGGKTIPPRDAVPPAYRDLVDWYHQEYAATARRRRVPDPILAARGAGRHLAGREHPDEQVRRLREGWA